MISEERSKLGPCKYASMERDDGTVWVLTGARGGGWIPATPDHFQPQGHVPPDRGTFMAPLKPVSVDPDMDMRKP